MLRILPVLLFALNFFQLSAQNTVGLISYDVSKSWDGYNLMFPHNQSSVFLINNCGELVHSWTDTADVVPGNTAYLKDDGRLVKGIRPRSVIGDFIKKASQLPGVLQLFHMAGDNDFILHVAVKDSDELRVFILDRLSTLDYIQSTQTTMVLHNEKVNNIL